MKGIFTAVLTILTVSLTLGAVAMPAHALFLEWDDAGQGMSGTDPLGQSWTFSGDDGVVDWGIPGVGEGAIPWAGADLITDFHITFDLPAGITLNESFLGTNFFTFRIAPFDPGSSEWTAMVTEDGKTVWFVAGPGQELDPGEEFFVSVRFTNILPQDFVTFQAEYTMDGVVVPEPAPPRPVRHRPRRPGLYDPAAGGAGLADPEVLELHFLAVISIVAVGA